MCAEIMMMAHKQFTQCDTADCKKSLTDNLQQDFEK